ncbi:Lytic transglycosylase domain-containing protein [Rickettsiales endosymbiont of Paramecium tredecaurelia]|nr:Lytic transglycosylase domain-containing protein [Candidatus Sarmatiella mevalonica]
MINDDTMRFAVIFFLTCAVHTHCYAITKEFKDSLKCIRYFRHFESKYNLPPDLLHAIALQESSKNVDGGVRTVWPWTVNTKGKGYFFQTKLEAMRFVRQELLSGNDVIDVGCMQINLHYHPNAFRTLNQAFDPRANIEYAAKFLQEKHKQLASWSKAIAHYHSANPHLGGRYGASVIRICENMDAHKTKLIRHIKYPSTSRAMSRKAVANVASDAGKNPSLVVLSKTTSNFAAQAKLRDGDKSKGKSKTMALNDVRRSKTPHHSPLNKDRAKISANGKALTANPRQNTKKMVKKVNTSSV